MPAARLWCVLLSSLAGLACVPLQAAAETSTSGWSQRVQRGPVTRPAEQPRRRREPTKGRARTKSLPAKRNTVAPKLIPMRPLPKSTLGPIMAEPVGANAAYIAFDQGQYITAHTLAKAAAERDEPEALTLLGRIYEKGLGVPKDELTAARLYRRGAELGDTEALFAFGVMLAAGRGIQKDLEGAAQLFERAARKGHPEANYNLGLLFVTGKGKPENPRRALMHIQYAAKQGLAPAQYDLAALYRKGHGINADAYQATHWLRTAAKSGMPAAQYDYAVALLQGRGFNRDKPDIVEYLRSAARQGVAGAQNRLAHIFAAGELVRLDMIEAAKWRLVAKASELPSTEQDKQLDDRIAKMKPAQRSRAQRAAEIFIEGGQISTLAADEPGR